MFSRNESTRRSNHSIFLPQTYGSPFNDTAEHISGLGLARIDFERCAVAGEVIYSVEGDSTPTSQQDEEARIATLAHALKKLGNPENAAEFMRCLNAICEGGDARYRQVAASYYYGEIAERGVGPVLKEMGLIAMHLASLNPVTEEVEGDSGAVYALSAESKPRSLFDREVAAVNRMIRGRRKSAGFVPDEWTEWLNDLEANGATVDELDDAFAHVEALEQYDENGAMSVKHFIALNTAADNQRERLLSAPLSATAYRLIEEIVTASEKKLGYLGWAMYGDNNPSHPIHTLNSCEQTRVWEFMTARKGAFLLPRLYARLCATVGRALPVACFILPAAFKEFLERPRLRKAISVVQNKRRASARKPSSAPRPAIPTRGASATKRGAAVKLSAEAAACGRQ